MRHDLKHLLLHCDGSVDQTLLQEIDSVLLVKENVHETFVFILDGQTQVLDLRENYGLLLVAAGDVFEVFDHLIHDFFGQDQGETVRLQLL